MYCCIFGCMFLICLIFSIYFHIFPNIFSYPIPFDFSIRLVQVEPVPGQCPNQALQVGSTWILLHVEIYCIVDQFNVFNRIVCVVVIKYI